MAQAQESIPGSLLPLLLCCWLLKGRWFRSRCRRPSTPDSRFPSRNVFFFFFLFSKEERRKKRGASIDI
jgi:hypothetical protein